MGPKSADSHNWLGLVCIFRNTLGQRQQQQQQTDPAVGERDNTISAIQTEGKDRYRELNVNVESKEKTNRIESGFFS